MATQPVMAAVVPLAGAAATFAGAYWLEKTGIEKSRAFGWLRPLAQMQQIDADGRAGHVLGIGYISSSTTGQSVGFLYGTMAILVISTIVHFYSSSHLTASRRSSSSITSSSRFVGVPEVPF